jgi:hypothetical protein
MPGIESSNWYSTRYGHVVKNISREYEDENGNTHTEEATFPFTLENNSNKNFGWFGNRPSFESRGKFFPAYQSPLHSPLTGYSTIWNSTNYLGRINRLFLNLKAFPEIRDHDGKIISPRHIKIIKRNKPGNRKGAIPIPRYFNGLKVLPTENQYPS